MGEDGASRDRSAHIKLSQCTYLPFIKRKKNLECLLWVSLVAQRVKCLPAMWKTWVPCLGQEDPLEEEMATHSSTLAWKIP